MKETPVTRKVDDKVHIIGRPPDDDPRTRWDTRYARGEGPRKESPHAWLVHHLWRVRPGLALDIACGMGRDSIWLARHGFRVHAVDISGVALQEARRRARRAGVADRIAFVVADLTRFALPKARYDLIIGFSYWEPSLLPALREAVRPGGFIIYETFNVWWRYTRSDVNEAYLVPPGGMRAWLQDWHIWAYREIGSDHPSTVGRKAVSSIVAQKPRQ